MLKNNYNTHILTDEYRRFELDLLEVLKIYILWIGKMKLDDIESIYSGKGDGYRETRTRSRAHNE